MSKDGQLYSKLTPAQRSATLSSLKSWLEAGNCSPYLGTSLLGLDWSCFVTREFPARAGSSAWMNPPEFVYYAHSILDVVATLMIRPRFSVPPHEHLKFSCSLNRKDSEDSLYLELEVTREGREINLDSGLIALMFILPDILLDKKLAIGDVGFQPGHRCVMHLAYPGQMMAAASPYFENRPVDLWPQVTLNLSPTRELRERAAVVMDFRLSSERLEGKPN